MFTPDSVQTELRGKYRCYRHIVQANDSEIWTIVAVQSVLQN